jgi:hypothetical protein
MGLFCVTIMNVTVTTDFHIKSLWGGGRCMTLNKEAVSSSETSEHLTTIGCRNPKEDCPFMTRCAKLKTFSRYKYTTSALNFYAKAPLGRAQWTVSVEQGTVFISQRNSFIIQFEPGFNTCLGTRPCKYQTINRTRRSGRLRCSRCSGSSLPTCLSRIIVILIQSGVFILTAVTELGLSTGVGVTSSLNCDLNYTTKKKRKVNLIYIFKKKLIPLKLLYVGPPSASRSTNCSFCPQSVIIFVFPIFFVNGSTAPWGPRASSLSRVNDHTLTHTPHSVGLLWTSDQPVAETST